MVREVRSGTVHAQGRLGIVLRGDHDCAACDSSSDVGRLERPGAGVPVLRIVALLQAGAPQVDGTGGPVVAVPGELPHNDPEPCLTACERARDLEPLPGGCECDARRAREVARIAVVHDGDGYLLRPGCDLRPDIERVLASGR